MSTTALRGPVRVADRPALSRCIRVGTAEFADEYWGRRALLSEAEQLGSSFDDLFSSAAVDELLADRALRTPFIRMAKEGRVLPAADFTAPGGFGAEIGDQVSADKVLAEFAAGSTIVLQGLHRTWAPLRAFSRQLVDDIGHPVQVNAYITPAQSRGFDPHYDVHDVFVLQIAGEKRWVVHPPVREHPFEDEPWGRVGAEVAARAAEPAAIDTVLRPGDALYLPRGWIHSATAQGGTTVHVTIGMPAFTRRDVARELLSGVLADDALRAPLPLGVDVGRAAEIADEVEAAAAALVAALRERAADAAPVADAMGRRFARLVRPEPVHPLAAVDSAAVLASGDLVRWRRFLNATITVDAGRVRIGLDRRSIALPAVAAAAIRALAEGADTPADALAGLDEADSLTVSRRLLREGVLLPVP